MLPNGHSQKNAQMGCLVEIPEWVIMRGFMSPNRLCPNRNLVPERNNYMAYPYGQKIAQMVRSHMKSWIRKNYRIESPYGLRYGKYVVYLGKSRPQCTKRERKKVFGAELFTLFSSSCLVLGTLREW
jgi:hypothetical protein